MSVMTNHIESLAIKMLEALCQDFLNTKEILSKSVERLKFQERLAKS